MTDEELARKLQQQYDQEYRDYAYAKKIQSQENTITNEDYVQVIEHIKKSDNYKKRKNYLIRHVSNKFIIKEILDNYKKK